MALEALFRIKLSFLPLTTKAHYFSPMMSQVNSGRSPPRISLEW